MSFPLYRARPVLVSAVRWDGTETMLALLKRSWTPALCFVRISDEDGVIHSTAALRVPTPEGALTAQVGDWVIRDSQGGLYPVRGHVFDRMYEQMS